MNDAGNETAAEVSLPPGWLENVGKEAAARVAAKGDSPLRINGVGRDAEDGRTLVIYLSRPATDDELRRLHDYLKGMQANG